MDAIWQIKNEDAFNERLKENMTLDPEQKRKRLSQVDKKANSSTSAYIEKGQRFDFLEYPDDVPIIPMCGSILPSERFLKMKHNPQQKGSLSRSCSTQT